MILIQFRTKTKHLNSHEDIRRQSHQKSHPNSCRPRNSASHRDFSPRVSSPNVATSQSLSYSKCHSAYSALQNSRMRSSNLATLMTWEYCFFHYPAGLAWLKARMPSLLSMWSGGEGCRIVHSSFCQCRRRRCSSHVRSSATWKGASFVCHKAWWWGGKRRWLRVSALAAGTSVTSVLASACSLRDRRWHDLLSNTQNG